MNRGAESDRFEKLVGSDNWLTWSFAIEAQLRLEGLWEFVAGSASIANAEKEEKARCRLVLSVDKALYVYVRNCTTANAVWKALKDLFEDSGLDRKVGLLQKLCSVQLEDCSSVEDYVSQIVTTSQKLGSIGFDVNDEWLGCLLLKGLPEAYRPMIMSLGSCGKKLSADSIKMKLLQDIRMEPSTHALASKKSYVKKESRTQTGNVMAVMELVIL